jgi:general L-amino acid transport system permease protein
LTKNSSLAVAIGFPDLVSILNTTANQTGHAIETMLIMIVTYLGLSLLVASVMNTYNRRLLRPAA